MCPADRTGQPLGSGAVRELTPSEREWLEVRSYLQEHRHDLAARAAEEFPASARMAGTPLLTAPGWQPAVPVPLPDISLELTAAADGAAANPWTPWPPGNAALPERADGTRYPSYSQALAELAAPAVFENRATYRLTAADLAPGAPRLTFAGGRYFDGIDTGEAAADGDGATDLQGEARDAADVKRRGDQAERCG